MKFSGDDSSSELYRIVTTRIEDDQIHINATIRDDVEEVMQAIINAEAFGDETKLNAVMFKGLFGTGKGYTTQYIRTKVSDVLCGGDRNKEIPMLFVGSMQRPEDVMKLYADARKIANERGRCIIFEDEADKYGKRGEIQDAAREAVLNQLLIEMQSTDTNEGVTTICCTNRPDRIDPAFRRGKRCGKEILFDPLDREGREHISRIEAYKRNHRFIFNEGDIEHVVSKTYGAVGADIAQFYTDAATYTNLLVMRSLEGIARGILFSRKPAKAKLTDMFRKLPLENLEVKFDEYVNGLVKRRGEFIKAQEDIKEDDEFREKKIAERYARKIFTELDPNPAADGEGGLGEDESREVVRWIRVEKESIDHVLEHFVPSALKDMPFEETDLNFSSFGGLDVQTAYLKRVVENTIAQDREGTSIFLYGQEGCGVTDLARAVAGEYGYNLIVMYGDDQESKWVGEVKDRLLEINDRAKASKPTIVVFDNIRYLALDARVADQSYKQTATSTLKSIIRPTKGVIYIGTGQDPEEVEPSVRSLFKRHIEVGKPSGTEAYVTIWERHIDPELLTEGVEIDYMKLAAASEELTGGGISNICRCFSELGAFYSQKKLEFVIGVYAKQTRDGGRINDIELAKAILSE